MIAGTWVKLKHILTKEQNEILSAASVLMVLGLATKIIGMFYSQLFTKEFDLGTQIDPFTLASVIPEYITNTILMGAISGSLIPIFYKFRKQSGNEAFIKSFSTVFNLCLIIITVLTLFAAIFAQQLIPFAIEVARPAVPPTPEQVNEIIWMMRALLVPQIILSTSAFLGTTLNIYNRYIIPQLAPLFFNVGRIVAILFLTPLLDGSIWAVVWGSWIGALLHLAVQIPLMLHLNIRVVPFLINFKNRELKEVLRAGLPRILSLSVEEIRIAFNTVLAFGLSTGAAGTYSLATRLISFPLTFLGYSFATASFTTFSSLQDKGDKHKFEVLVSQVINQVLFLSIPISVAFIVMRVPIVRLTYGLFKGELDWEGTLKIAWVVLFFSLGLAFETLRAVILRIYYSIHNTIVPMVSSFLIVVVGLTLGILFSNYLSHFDTFDFRVLTWNPEYFFEKSNGIAGVGGLALSSSIIYTIEFFGLLYWLKRLGAISNLRTILSGIGKKVIAGISMFIVMYAMAKLWDQVLDTAQTLQLAMLTFTTLAASFILYLWLSFVLRIPEVEVFAGFIHRKLKKYFSSK